MTISVIVPVYNVEGYLRICLDSLYSQIEDDMEIILVNDGSTDNSLAVCMEYAKRYKNTIVLDKENGGLSDARNAGTELATGEYIYYLDSDDWLSPGAIKTLYDYAVENQCEVVQGGFYYAYDDYLLFDNRYKQPFSLERYEAMLELIRNKNVKNFAWGKLYRVDLVKRHQFPKGKFFEDAYWQHLVIHEVTKYGIVPFPLYYYRQRNTGISGVFSVKNLDLLKGYEERLNFINKNYPEYLFEMTEFYWNVRQQFCEVAEQSKSIEIRKCFRMYRAETEERYGRLFRTAMKNILKYRLCSMNSWTYSLYKLIERINNSFFPKYLKRIDYRNVNERTVL